MDALAAGLSGVVTGSEQPAPMLQGLQTQEASKF